MDSQPSIRCFVALVLGLFLLAACEAPRPPVSPVPTPDVQGTELPFETVLKGDWSTYRGEDSRILLATDAETLQPIIDLVTDPKEREQIAKVDLSKYAVIAVLRGLKATSGYEVDIQYVVRQDDKLYVYARIWEPGPGWPSTQAETYPFQIVQIPWTSGENETIQPILMSYPAVH